MPVDKSLKKMVMVLFEFSDAQSQINLWKLVSNSVLKAISVETQY
jgi:hypothetical protein